jgi:hypothetical protein
MAVFSLNRNFLALAARVRKNDGSQSQLIREQAN